MAARAMKTPALAKASGVPYGTLRRILELNTVADYEQLQKIADALRMPLSQIILDAEKLAQDPEIIAESASSQSEHFDNRDGEEEQERIEATLAQLRDDPMTLAALHDPNKYIEAEGDAYAG